MNRRALLSGVLATGVPALAGCVVGPERRPSPAPVLVAYFSRAGENYYYGGRRRLAVGNTEVLAERIAAILGARAFRIEAAEPYDADYDATVARNVREQDEDARPAMAGPLPDLAPYRTVLLGSPIWNVQTPMILRTFAESLDFGGKVVHPFTTHAMSGLGRASEIYAGACRGATIGDGLAVRGEEVDQSEPAVRDWLRRTGLLV